MTFLTKLYLQSGDRTALDGVVDEIRSAARRKGAELEGPHSNPPERFRVPQYHGVGGGEFAPWEYTVYSRDVVIVGHDQFARRVAAREFPAAVHVAVEVEQRRPVGGG